MHIAGGIWRKFLKVTFAATSVLHKLQIQMHRQYWSSDTCCKICALEAQQLFQLFVLNTIYPLFMLAQMCKRSCWLRRNAWIVCDKISLHTAGICSWRCCLWFQAVLGFCIYENLLCGYPSLYEGPQICNMDYIRLRRNRRWVIFSSSWAASKQL
jgi:hypothetical protein